MRKNISNCLKTNPFTTNSNLITVGNDVQRCKNGVQTSAVFLEQGQWSPAPTSVGWLEANKGDINKGS